MTINKLTDELVEDSELQMLIDSHEKGTAMFMRVNSYYLMAKELQEHRTAVEDKDLLGVIDALEHPAGINAAGKQVVRRALVELQEIRRSYLALRGEIEDVQSQLYEADNQANEYAAELQERRKADSEREQVRSAHAEWSLATFGDVGPVGPLKHLSKEAMEAAAEPDDHSEWADMQFLLWDAQRRAGISDEQITQAMVEKLAVNKQREWPEPKDGEPRLHIKEQPAPENEAQATLKRLAVILHGSEVDLNLLTVTAQSLMDRCKAGNSPVTTE